jgi:uncharacterized protein YcnI
MRIHGVRSLVVGALLVGVQGMASAHAVVYPKQVVAGSYEKFALRVPNEKEIPTVKVKVEIPAGFVVSRVQPLPGWTYTFTKDSSGNVTAIEWTGGEIGAAEFQEFIMSGKAPAQPGKTSWKAYQTYKDGSVAEWTGPSDAKTPASIVEVVAGTGTTDAHGEVHDAKPASTAGAVAEATHGATGWAAWGGLGLGALALIVALFKKK